jgi:hypothetical protein
MDDIPARRERTLVEAGAAPAEPWNPPLLSWNLRFDEAGSLPPPKTQSSTEQGGGEGAKFSGAGRTAGGGGGGSGGGSGGGAATALEEAAAATALEEAAAPRFFVRTIGSGEEVVMCGTGGQQRNRVAM